MLLSSLLLEDFFVIIIKTVLFLSHFCHVYFFLRNHNQNNPCSSISCSQTKTKTLCQSLKTLSVFTVTERAACTKLMFIAAALVQKTTLIHNIQKQIVGSIQFYLQYIAPNHNMSHPKVLYSGRQRPFNDALPRNLQWPLKRNEQKATQYHKLQTHTMISNCTSVIRRLLRDFCFCAIQVRAK